MSCGVGLDRIKYLELAYTEPATTNSINSKTVKITYVGYTLYICCTKNVHRPQINDALLVAL